MVRMFFLRRPSKDELQNVLQEDINYNRVCLSIKDNECCVMFYEEAPLLFMRYLIVGSESEGPIVYQMVDTFDEKEAEIIHVRSKFETALHAACSLLTFMLTTDSVRTFELEFAERDEKKQLELVRELQRLMGRIYIERLVLNPKTHKSVIPLLKGLIFKFKDNAIVDIEEPSLDDAAPMPFVVYERILEYDENGGIIRTANHSAECHTIDELLKFSLEDEGPVTMRFRTSPSDIFGAFSQFEDEFEPVNEKVVMMRVPYPESNRIIRFCQSECAVWFHCVKPEDEDKYEKFYENETCGGGNMCKKCSNPFDYQYYLDFYHRLLHEPEWMRAMWIPDDAEKAALFDEDMKRHREFCMQHLMKTEGEYAKKILRQLNDSESGKRLKESQKAAREKAQKKNEKNRRKRENKKNRMAQEKKESEMQGTEKSLALVRLLINENKCMFVIYKNIEEVSTQTFLETPEGVTVTHMDNVREEKTFKFTKIKLLDLLCRALKTALSDSKIENFELGFPGMDDEKQEELVKEIEKSLKKSKGSQNVFRAKRVVVSNNVTETLDVVLENLFDLDELEDASKRFVIIENDSLIPTVAYEYIHGTFGKNTMINTHEKPNLEKLKFMASAHKSLATMRAADGSTKLFDEQMVHSVRVNKNVEMKRIVDEDQKLVLRYNKSTCGMWIHCVKLKCEAKFQKYFENETCGLHHFCQKCSSPFDYWYHQNMPRHFYDQPDWCKVVSSSGKNALKNQEDLKKNSEDGKKKEEQEKRRHWSGMRAEDKQEVIKSLDLMSRHAMRCVSRADREIVDSTDHYVPRVRLSLKEDNAVVTIYTGIEKFLRVEIKRGYGGVLVYRMENTYNRKKASVKLIRSAVLPTAMSILQTLFVHKSVLLGTLELETVERSVRRQYIIFAMMLRCLQTHWHPENVFRAKRFTVNDVIGDRLKHYMVKELFDSTVLKDVESENLTLDATGNTNIREMISFRDVKEHGVKTITNEYGTIKRPKCYTFPTERISDTVSIVYASRDDSIKYIIPNSFEKIGSARVNEQVVMNRYLNKNTGVVVRLNKSLKCGGRWFYHLPDDQEGKFKEMFKNETCGLRHLCKTCSDPFDYWFYSKLAWRVYNEPDYIDIQCIDGLYYEPDYFDDVKFMKEKLNKYIRELFKIELQKQRSNGEMAKKSGVGESWGFTKMIDKDVDTVVSDVMTLSDLSSSDDEEDSDEESS